MGKNDLYMDQYYRELLSVLPNPKDSFFLFIKPHDARDLLKLCKQLYTENKPINGFCPRIPRVFHQIWVGTKPFPQEYKLWQKTWQNVPGWQYKLWTDEDVEKLEFPNKQLYFAEKNMGARADILRIELLYQYGGVYVDADFELLKSEFFDALNTSYDFYCGLSPLDQETLVINNALIGSIAQHPVIAACREGLAKKGCYKKGTFDIVNNGPGLLTKMILTHAGKGYRDIILPPTFLYPLGINQKSKNNYLEMPLEELCYDIKRDVSKPESIAIHWWEGSWKVPEPCACLFCKLKQTASSIWGRLLNSFS